MSGIFTMVITDAGLAAIDAAEGPDLALTFTEIAFGTGLYDVRDGAGEVLPSAQALTALSAEVERINLTAAAPMAERQVMVIATLPGGAEFDVGEFGIFLDDGTLFCVASRASSAYFTRGASETALQFILSWDAADAAAVNVTTNGDAALALLAINVANLEAALETKLDKAGGTIGGDLVVDGNLTVNGDTTTVNSDELHVGDSIVRLNADLDGAVAPSLNCGIEVNRGSSADVTFLWNETTDHWELSDRFRVFGNAEVYGRVLSVSNENAPELVLTDTTAGHETKLRSIDSRTYLSVDASNTVSSSEFVITIDGSTAVTIQHNKNATFAGNIDAQGTIAATSGTPEIPSFRFVGNNSSGMYSIGDNILGFSAGGLEALRLDTAMTLSVDRILRANSSDQLVIAGGPTASDGGNIFFYGSAHPTNAGDTVLRSGSQNIMFYDASAALFRFYDNVNIDDKLTVSGGVKISVQGGVDGTSAQGIFLNATNDSSSVIYAATSGPGKSAADAAACSSLDGRVGYHTRIRIANSTARTFLIENSSEACLMSLTGDTGVLYSLGGFFTSGKLTVNGGSKISVQNKVDGGNAQGIFLWDTDEPSWGLYLARAGSSKSLSNGLACDSLAGSTGMHIRVRVNDQLNSGFIWENSAEECLMSLTADTGDLHIKRQTFAKAHRATANRTITGDDAVTADDYRLFVKRAVGAPTSLTLPAGFAGAEFVIKDANFDARTHNITITGTGGELIDGDASFIINRDGQSITIVFHDGAWYVI